MDWAETRAGAPYVWGGTGPGYDCSGLVMEAYLHAGVRLPRTTYEMLSSPLLVRTWNPHRGDLAFYGTGHVELVTVHPFVTYGAQTFGTLVGWHLWFPGSGWQPTMYFWVR